MRTLFSQLKKKLGQAAKPTTARQVYTLQNFKFLEGHLTVHTEIQQLGKVVASALSADLEEEEEEEETMTMPPV